MLAASSLRVCGLQGGGISYFNVVDLKSLTEKPVLRLGWSACMCEVADLLLLHCPPSALSTSIISRARFAFSATLVKPAELQQWTFSPPSSLLPCSPLPLSTGPSGKMASKKAGRTGGATGGPMQRTAATHQCPEPPISRAWTLGRLDTTLESLLDIALDVRLASTTLANPAHHSSWSSFLGESELPDCQRENQFEEIPQYQDCLLVKAIFLTTNLNVTSVWRMKVVESCFWVWIYCKNKLPVFIALHHNQHQTQSDQQSQYKFEQHNQSYY